MIAPAAATVATAGDHDPGDTMGQRQTVAPPGPPMRRLCAYCLAPLENGAAYCSEECADRLWDITPRVDGEV